MEEPGIMLFLPAHICNRNSLDIFPFTTESYSFVTEQKQKTALREFLCPQSLKAVKPFWSFHCAAQAAAGWAGTPMAHLLGLCYWPFTRVTVSEIKGTSPTIQHQSDWEGNAELLIHTLKLLSNVMITISTFLIGFDTVNFVYVNSHMLSVQLLYCGLSVHNYLLLAHYIHWICFVMITVWKLSLVKKAVLTQSSLLLLFWAYKSRSVSQNRREMSNLTTEATHSWMSHCIRDTEGSRMRDHG